MLRFLMQFFWRCCSVAKSCLFASHGWQQAKFPCLSLSLGVCANSCPLTWWCQTTTSSSVTSYPPALNRSQHQGILSNEMALGGQSTGASAAASVLPINIQGWFPLGLTGLISLQSKGLSRVLSSSTVQKHHFLHAQLSLWTNSHIHTWLPEKP